MRQVLCLTLSGKVRREGERERERGDFETGLISLTLCGEVEERGLLVAVGQLDVGLSQLVEEGVCTGLQRRQAGRGRVLQ